MERAIARNEVAVVRWLLDHAAVGDMAGYRLCPIEALRVLDGCNCGCTSLDFQPNSWSGSSIIADGFAIYSDGQQAGLILWGRNGGIALLEVYDCDPNASHRFPNISDLRSFADGMTAGRR